MPDRSVRPLPMSIEEIDRGWLTAALREKAPGVSVRDAQFEVVRRGTCTLLRVRLDMDEAGKRAGIPDTVILKTGMEPHSRDMAQMHEREVQGYRDVFPVLKLPTPACYFADYAEDQGQGVVIMEDLTKRGVSFCSPLAPQTHEQVARRLGVMARFHAQTWDSPEFQNGRWAWAQQIMPHMRIYMDMLMEPQSWRGFVESPRGAATSVCFHDRERMSQAVDKLVRLAARRPHVLIHGDAHLGNLYIDADGGPGFFDALPARAPIMKEVSYHIAGALDSADRRRSEGALVQHYLDELRRAGVDAPPFDEAMGDYSAFLAMGFLIFLTNLSTFQSEAINTAYAARFSMAMIDHDTLGLIDALD